MEAFNFNEDLLSYGWIVSKIQPPKLSAIFIVKATLKLQPGQDAAAGDDEPEPLSGDRYSDDDPHNALYYPSDFAPQKPRADLLLHATAYAPGGKPAPQFPVRWEVGGFSKELTIMGPRQWEGLLRSRPGAPEPIRSVPVDFAHAFGGKDSSRNPVGRGKGNPELPNVGLPRTVKTMRADDPAGFAPVHPDWDQRKSLVGTYDQKWSQERWPWFPDDFDWGYFNAALDDQQVPYLRGDEKLLFENLHPEQARYACRLPGLRARCLVQDRLPDSRQRCREVPLQLDTLWVDLNQEKMILVWRGQAEVQSLKLREVERVLVLAEPLGEPAREPARYFAVLDERLQAEDAAFEAEFTEMDNPQAEADFDREMAEMDKEGAALEAKLAELEREATQLDANEKEALLAHGLDEGIFTQVAAADSAEGLAEFTTANQEFLQNHPELAGDLQEMDAAGDADRQIAQMDKEIDAQDPFPDAPPLDRAAVMAAAKQRSSLADQSLAGLDLSGLDLAGMSFRDSDLKGAKLANARLAGADFTAADLTGADLSAADLTGAILDAADLSDAQLAGAKLTNLSLQGAILAGLDLAGADLSGAKGEGADFTDANLEAAQLIGVNLPRADFSKARLSKTLFVGAVLAHSDVEAAIGAQVNMEGADLTGLRASDARFPGGKFRQVQAGGSTWDGALLDYASFSRSRLDSAQFADASLRGADFDRASLVAASFDGALLSEAILSNANLLRASFAQADLTKANLGGSNLYGAGFWEARRDQANFQQANLKGTTLG